MSKLHLFPIVFEIIEIVVVVVVIVVVVVVDIVAVFITVVVIIIVETAVFVTDVSGTESSEFHLYIFCSCATVFKRTKRAC